MNLCIFDDEVIFQAKLNDMIEDYLDVNYPELDYSVHCFTHTHELLKHITANKADIVFLDISTNEDENDGLWTARGIRSINEKTHIIFVTSRKDKIAQSFDGFVRPTDFLIKPVDQGRVHELLENIVRQMIRSYDYISFKFGRIEYLLRIDEICSIQKFAHKMIVSTENRSIEVTNTISGLRDILPDHFVQVDKGIIINLNFTYEIDYAKRCIDLKNGMRFSISRNARASVKEAVCRIAKGDINELFS
jgi:DNA-binding LytR/AlgR family response regulator